MSLEGAAWDLKSRLLNDIEPGLRFSDFPGLRLRTVAVPRPSRLRTMTSLDQEEGARKTQ